MGETMAEVSNAEALSVESAGSSHSFIFRRLHSLTGIIPVGGFLLFHIFENMAAIRGPEAYDEGILHLANLMPAAYFYLIEIFVLGLPILFHGFYGLYITFTGKTNVSAYQYRSNWLYFAQRVTGVLAFAFILYHIYSLRIAVTMMGAGAGLDGHPGYVTHADVVSHYASNGVLVAYIIGTLSSAFHLGNGLNGFCWTWGLAVGERSRRIVEIVGWVLFVAAAVPMLHILYSFRQF